MAGGYVVTGALVTITDVNGRIHYVHQGRPVVVDATADELKRLAGKGLIKKVKASDAAAGEPVATPTDLPAAGDTRPVWDAYARSLGIDPAEYSKKPELIEAVTAAHEAKAAGGESGEGSGN